MRKSNQSNRQGIFPPLFFSHCRTGKHLHSAARIPAYACISALILALPGYAADYETFLEPSKIIDLSSPYREKLEKVLVANGDHVEKGQILAEIGASVLKPQLQRAKEAATVHGDIDAAEAMVTMRSNRLQLLETIGQSGNTRPQELIAARTDLSMAKAQLLKARDEQKLRQLEVKVIEAQLNDKFLKSPVAGVIRKVYKQEGELTGGMDNEPVMTLIQLDPLLAVFYLPPKTGLSFKQNQQVKIHADNKIIMATLNYVSPVIDPQSGTVEIRMEIANPGGTLIAGRRCQLSSPGETEHDPGSDQATD